MENRSAGHEELMNLAARIKEAAPALSPLPREKKDEILLAGAQALLDSAQDILAANALDIEAGQKKGLSTGLLDRLALTDARIGAMAEGIRQVAELHDPVGELMWQDTRPNGLHVRRVRVPFGIIGMIYEARPNVTADAFALCLKTGNAVMLRGGSDALRSNHAIVKALRGAIASCGVPEDVLVLLEAPGHDVTHEMMRLSGTLDLLIPRGGAGLIRSCLENAAVPVIETGTGNCFLYVDEEADLDMAQRILINGKTQRVGVCNALESLLVHEKRAAAFLPGALKALEPWNVTVHGDETVCALYPKAVPATEEDWGREYLDYEISARIVSSVDEAIAHVNRYHTRHSDAIVTKIPEHGRRFQNEVDAACVYVNASTRFTDGFEFGFGAEIGISTQKLHARGPMGLEALTTYKYLIDGDGQVRG
ncbi:MAG: glutamate-5-semialdehyde dehydrogenase [Lachnospiraceae bacterium]|nr:glutamate-5-semialdehyde dehydrogenase [Lachnospiraceae bacterium]